MAKFTMEMNKKQQMENNMIKKQIIKGYEKVNDTTAHILLEATDEVTLDKLLIDRKAMQGILDDAKDKLEKMEKEGDELIEVQIERLKIAFNNQKKKLQQTIETHIQRLENLDIVIAEIKKLGIIVSVKKEDKNVNPSESKK